MAAPARGDTSTLSSQMESVDVIPASPKLLRLPEFTTVEVSPEDILRNGRLDMYASLKRKGYFTVRVGISATRIQAGGHVGVIPINDRLTIEVVPRVPLGNFSRLLEVSQQAPMVVADAIRLYDTEGQLYPSLAGIYATGLREQLEQIVHRGLLKDYQRSEELTSFPRGRVNVGQTMQRAVSRGVSHRASVSYFQRSVDNPPNRCLLAAVWRLSQYVGQTGAALPHQQRRRIQRDLNYCVHQLRGVQTDLAEGFQADGIVTGRRSLPALRMYYRPALDLALTVIGREAVLLERHGDRLRLPSLVVDMSTVFEAYARRTLLEASKSGHWPVVVLDGNKKPPVGGAGELFDSGIKTPATPDIVFQHRQPQAGGYPLLIEVKYKPATDLPDRGDLNQAITYATSYRCDCVVILQPRGERSRLVGLQHLGTIGTISVYHYVFDLAAPDLAEAEQRLSDSLIKLAVSA